MNGFRAALIAACLAAAPAAAFAHHSVSGQFDVGQTLAAQAVLSKVEWINPHTYMTFEVKDENGASRSLALESMTPAALRRAGLSGREALKVGDTYTVYYSPSRNGNVTRGLMHAFTMPDGRTIGALSQKGLDQVKEHQAKAKKTKS